MHCNQTSSSGRLIVSLCIISMSLRSRSLVMIDSKGRAWILFRCLRACPRAFAGDTGENKGTLVHQPGVAWPELECERDSGKERHFLLGSLQTWRGASLPFTYCIVALDMWLVWGKAVRIVKESRRVSKRRQLWFHRDVARAQRPPLPVAPSPKKIPSCSSFPLSRTPDGTDQGGL